MLDSCYSKPEMALRFERCQSPVSRRGIVIPNVSPSATMTDAPGRYRSKPEQAHAMEVMDVLWLTAGLGCDGDTIAMTAATQPSIEDLISGAIPGVPRYGFITRCSLMRTAASFSKSGTARLRVRSTRSCSSSRARSRTRRTRQKDYWAGFGTDPATGQPITTCQWLERLAPRAWAVVAAGTCSSYGGIHAMAGNPTGCMGLPDYLGWQWRSRAGIPLICIPGCPVLPDNMTETLLYLLSQAVGRRR